MTIRTESFPTMGDYGIYIHLPFCASKCPYCHFVSMVGGETLFERYIGAIHRELALRGITKNTLPPRTIYIGGGTPSLVPAPFIVSILDRISGPGTIEISIEANPDSLTPEWLENLHDAGVTRLSIGVQSLDNRDLQTLGRIHTAEQALESLRYAVEVGFDSISADIIFGVPGQTPGSLIHTLEILSALPVSHLSCYGLSIEEDTVYWELANTNKFNHPDPGLYADMYLMIDSYLSECGFERYEISNYAKPGHTCLHNQAYWNFTPYIGLGASAHSFDGNRRFWNTVDIAQYIEKIENNDDPVAGEEIIDPVIRQTEEIMLSLRTARGLTQETINKLPASILQRIGILCDGGYLEPTVTAGYRLTRNGVVLADEIIAELTAHIR